MSGKQSQTLGSRQRSGKKSDVVRDKEPTGLSTPAKLRGLTQMRQPGPIAGS
jgi:hypothetical protein